MDILTTLAVLSPTLFTITKRDSKKQMVENKRIKKRRETIA